MINRYKDGKWEGLNTQEYKDEPGTWVGVNRVNFAPDLKTQFECRAFTILPGGYTTLEQHRHEHCVVVLSGNGEVNLDGVWQDITLGDSVHVLPMQPHQFRNQHSENLIIICVVDRIRDRPIPL